jgi:probable phosphoglycerate mutase
MQLIVLRHGATHWNIDRRIQGRADLPLAPAGRAQVASWRLVPAWLELPCLASPLRRARETAKLLGLTQLSIVPELIEMDWGRFEGATLAELRAEAGLEFAANEANGLDFRPLDGESPREVMVRLSRWLMRLPAGEGQAVVITHKGVRRALLALATGWDMRGPPPIKAHDEQAMLLDVQLGGHPVLHGVHSLGGST